MFPNADSLPVGHVIPAQIRRLLAQEIILGRLAPETRLTEEDVAETYGISRSPVREALRLLEQDGLVNRSARRGIWVAPMSVEDFDEVYRCRMALEGIAAETAAASSLAPTMRLRFDALLDRLRAAKDACDAPTFFLADVEGSELIYTLSANATLRRLLASLEKQALRYRFFVYAQSPDVVRLSTEGTALIYDKICTGETDAAKRLTEGLIGDIWRTMRGVIAASFPPER